MLRTGTVREELLARIDAVAPTLEADIPLGEELRRLPDTTVEALRGADLLRLKVPHELGGDEAEPVLQFEVFERVASHNIAAAWCLFIWADALGAAAARIPDAGIARIFDGPRAPVMCGGGGLRPGTLRPVPGGFRLSGRYRYGSGIDASDWVLVMGAVDDGGRREVRNCVVARADVDVEDNWHVLGLRATGSADYAVHDAFVHEELTYVVSGPPLRGGRLFRTGLVGYLGYPLPAVAIGLVRRVLDELVAGAGKVTRGYTKPKVLAERQAFQHGIGEADQRLKAARALMLASGTGLMDAVDAGIADLRPIEAEVRAAGAYAVRLAADVLADLVRFGGGEVVRQGSVYERAVRDLTTAANHLLVNDSAFENHAQFLLGLPGADALA